MFTTFPLHFDHFFSSRVEVFVFSQVFKRINESMKMVEKHSFSSRHNPIPNHGIHLDRYQPQEDWRAIAERAGVSVPPRNASPAPMTRKQLIDVIDSALRMLETDDLLGSIMEDTPEGNRHRASDPSC